MNRLDKLESQSIFIIREAYKSFKNIGMLWSIGKDSTVLLWLAKKAFFGHVPFELIHIDTNYKIPEMIAYRDRLAKEIKLRLVVGQNKKALAEKKPFPTAWTGFRCCKELKTIPQNRIRPQNPCAGPSLFGVDGTEYLGIYRAGKNPHHSHLLGGWETVPFPGLLSLHQSGGLPGAESGGNY